MSAYGEEPRFIAAVDEDDARRKVESGFWWYDKQTADRVADNYPSCKVWKVTFTLEGPL